MQLKSDYDSFFYNTILDCEAKKSNILKMQDNCTGFWETILFHYYKKDTNHKKNWCDIEALIQDTLELLYFGKSKWLGNVTCDIRYAAMQYAKSYEEFNSYSTFADLLISYCSKCFLKYLRRNEALSEKELNSLLSSELVKELNNFEKKFCKYIKTQIKNSNFDYIIKASNLLFEIIGNEHKFFRINDILRTRQTNNAIDIIDTDHYGKNALTEWFDCLRPIHILSFNYAALFDILGATSPCVYNNVHGKLCETSCKEDCERSNIIFGIDDMSVKSQNIENDLRLFSKTYRKLTANGLPTKILPQLNDGQVVIKFYGHSLSKADYSYFQSIFDYYNLYSNYNVSLEFYYSEGYEQYDAIYRLINEYGNSLTNKEQGKNLIHKLLLENRISIKKVS